MNFGFTEEQVLLRDQVRKFIEQKCPMSEVRKISQTKEGMSVEHWQEMGQLGWTGLLVPEDFGGAGLNWVDALVLLEEMGRGLFPSPFISHSLACFAIAELGTEDQKQLWLPKLASGEKIGTVALLEETDLPQLEGIQLEAKMVGDHLQLNGSKHFVSDVNTADLFIVAARTGPQTDQVSLLIVDKKAEAVSTKTQATVDKTKREGLLQFEQLKVPSTQILGNKDGAADTINRLFDCGAVAVTAEMIGSSEGAHALTVDYAKNRIQFDNPIGKYQGVKHPLANMYVDIESFKSLLYYAAWCVNESPQELSKSISLAKAYASETVPKMGIDCLQLHGAIGYTAEYDIQLYLKRSKWARPKFGDANFHYDRVASLGEY
ncbi:MAG TPA: acyl-CoA dehydrogenase [Gammaproteobacteria bacterium]|nr:acyl-CoA dehydrogenase [Gammaproteobacteria bacterium]